MLRERVRWLGLRPLPDPWALPGIISDEDFLSICFWGRVMVFVKSVWRKCSIASEEDRLTGPFDNGFSFMIISSALEFS